MYKDTEVGNIWIKCEDGSVRSLAEDVGVSHVIKNLKTWLWLSGFILWATVPLKGSYQEMVMFDFKNETLEITIYSTPRKAWTRYYSCFTSREVKI